MSMFDGIEVSGKTKATKEQIAYIVDLYEALNDLDALAYFDDSITLPAASRLIDELKKKLNKQNCKDHELTGLVYKEF